MKANELRIGNYIKLKKTTSLDENYFELSQFRLGTFFINKEQLDLVEPIPLTEEWLLKFGFLPKSEDEEDNLIYDKDGFEITKNCFKDEFWIDANIITPKRIKHVHQLQNLYFALMGEELTVSS